MCPPRLLGHLDFTGGRRRPVWEDEGGQYVEDDGVQVRGVWLRPDDEADAPMTVQARETAGTT